MTSAASRHRGQWDRCRSGRGVRGLERRISGASPRCGASSEATCICAGCCRIPAGRAACAPGQGHRSRQLGADPRRGHPPRHHRILNDPSRKNAVAFERRHQLSGIAKCGICGSALYAQYPHGRDQPKVYVCRPTAHLHVRVPGWTPSSRPWCSNTCPAMESGAGLRANESRVDLEALRTQRAAVQAQPRS